MPPDNSSNKSASSAVLNIDAVIYPKQGDRRIVSIENLVIAGNVVVSVLGPNGAGKTSLLRVISQDVQAAGNISFTGNNHGDGKWKRSIYHYCKNLREIL